MKLAWKTLIVVVAMVLGMAVGTHALVSHLVMRHLLAEERREATDRAVVTARVLREQAAEFRVVSQDWAVWTDMVEFAREPNPTFAEQNMTLAAFQLKRWHHMAVVRSADHHVAWAGALAEPEKVGPASAELLTLAKRLAVPPDEEAPTDGYVSIDGEMFILASQPLRNADGRPGSTRGAMVYTKRLDDAWVQKIRELTRLELRVVPQTEEPARVAALSGDRDVLLEIRDDTSLATYTLLRDIGGEPLAIVEISHTRPHFAAAREMQRAISIAIAVGAGLLGLFAYAVVHFGLLRRIRELVKLVAAIEHGATPAPTRTEDPGRRGDELERLGREVRHLAQVLAEREANLRIAEDLAHAVLTDIDEALVLCDASGNVLPDVSATAKVWFGEAEGKIWSYLGDARRGWLLELGLEQLVAGFLPMELALAQLPTSFQRGRETFFVRYQPLRSGEDITGLVLVIEHATERVALAKSEAIATEVCNVLRHAIDEPHEFRAFTRDAEQLLRLIDEASDDAARLRAIHTLKGNAACFGMRSVADAAHLVEERLADEPGSFGEHASALRDAWSAAMTRIRAEVDLDDDSLTVAASEYEAVIALLAQPVRPSRKPSMAPSGAPCG